MSRRRYDAVLLDVDGTLVDSNDAHAHAWLAAFSEAKVEASWPLVRGLIGMGGDRLIEIVAGLAVDSPENAALGRRRSALFRERWLREVRPLPGTRELVLRLRDEGLEYAIASAAREEELTPLLEIARIADLCAVATTSDDVEESKPEPDLVVAALEHLGVAADRAVMIGDTPYDIAASQAAHVDIIAVTSGGWSQAELGGAVAVYGGPADLLASWDQSGLGH